MASDAQRFAIAAAAIGLGVVVIIIIIRFVETGRLPGTVTPLPVPAPVSAPVSAPSRPPEAPDLVGGQQHVLEVTVSNFEDLPIVGAKVEIFDATQVPPDIGGGEAPEAVEGGAWPLKSWRG
jgi:hypothetical protein